MRFHALWCNIYPRGKTWTATNRIGEIALETLEKFCPICKNKNDRNAFVCIHCGASLEEHPTGIAKTTRNTGGIFIDSGNIPTTVIDNGLIPEGGVAIYAAGTLKPFYLRIDKEMIIGRKVGDTPENFLDLSELDGFNMGLSRRHAMIRKAEVGYEVIDLSSTNGTWLNDERLVPDKPYQIMNGAQLRVGRLKLLVIYHADERIKKKE